MSETSLTPFQVSVEGRVRSLLQRLGKVVTEREIRAGTAPFYSKDEQTAVKLSSEDLEVWLFDDEASFSGPNGGGRFERDDFSSQDELANALLARLEAVLSGK